LSAGVVACSSGGGPTPRSAASATPPLPAACTAIRSPKALTPTHIEDGQTATYDSTPPTSGAHYRHWVTTGIYAESIQNERQVHNLEHGHVLIQYRALDSSQINALEAVVQGGGRMLILAPYPDMDPKISFTSWGKIQTCDAWSDGIPELARFFIAQNRDHAPESIP